jgi:hypothetical protein
MAAQGGVLRALTGEDTVLRALLRRGEVTDPRTAFLIRASERDTGLSVNYDMTPDQCRAQGAFKSTYGVRSLPVASITALNLEVVPDDPNHANIRGIPHTDDDPALAEFLAGQLLSASTLVSEGLVKNPPPQAEP